jgi:hypothetical protein
MAVNWFGPGFDLVKVDFEWSVKLGKFFQLFTSSSYFISMAKEKLAFAVTFLFIIRSSSSQMETANL